MKKIVIIGNGISGISAALGIRKRSSSAIVVVSSEHPRFFSRTAMMYVFMGKLRVKDTEPFREEFWKEQNIDLKYDCVTEVRASFRQIVLKSGDVLTFDQLVIASGSVPKRLEVPGAHSRGVFYFYHLQDLERMHREVKGRERVVIVGGGLTAVEIAEMMRSRKCQVTMVVRDTSFWGAVVPEEEGALLQNHLESQGVNILTGMEITEVLHNAGDVKAVKLNDGNELECSVLCIAIGVEPNIRFLQDSGIEISRGVQVDAYCKTSVAGIYAIGDCAEFRTALPGRKPIEQVWYTGQKMGETVAATISGTPTAYSPGVWFNSARFFDLDYHIVGGISPDPVQGTTSFLWKHKYRPALLRIQWRSEDGIVLGIHAIGIKLSHRWCEEIIGSGRTIHTMIEDLEKCWFEGEFARTYTREISTAFFEQHPKN